MALEQNREVFAVPGSPLDPRAEGTNALIKQGAVLVTEAEDVLDVLRPIIGRRREQAFDGAAHADGHADAAGRAVADARARILALLGPTPVAIDDLIRLSGASPPSCRRRCWNSSSPAASSASAAAWSRCYDALIGLGRRNVLVASGEVRRRRFGLHPARSPETQLSASRRAMSRR